MNFGKCHECPDCNKKFSLPNFQKGLSFCPYCDCHLVSPYQDTRSKHLDKQLKQVAMVLSIICALLAFIISFFREQELATSIINLFKTLNWHMVFAFLLFPRLVDVAIWWRFQRITYYKKGFDSLEGVLNDSCPQYANTIDRLMPKDKLPFTCSECGSQRIVMTSNKEYQTSHNHIKGRQDHVGMDYKVTTCLSCHTAFKLHKTGFDKSEKNMIIFLGVVIIWTILEIIFSHVVISVIEFVSDSRFFVSIIWALIGYVAIFAVLPYPAKHARPKPFHKLIKLT